MTGPDDDDRAIARALGAETEDDGAVVDAQAVADYETVLSHFPFAEVAPRHDLEDEVVGAALARRPAAARAIDGARSASARRRASRRWIAAGVSAVAAVAVVVLLIAGRPASGPGFGARIEPAAANGDLAHVLAERGTRQAALLALGGTSGGRAALDPQGEGYLTALRLPTTEGATDWLWLDTASGPVRVGILAPAPVVHFVVHGDAATVRGVIVTTEPTGRTPSVPAPLILRATFAN